MDSVSEPPILTGFHFKSGSTQSNRFTDISSFVFWKIGQKYKFTVHSGDYVDSFNLTFPNPSRDQPFSYVKTEHFYVIFEIYEKGVFQFG